MEIVGSKNTKEKREERGRDTQIRKILRERHTKISRGTERLIEISLAMNNLKILLLLLPWKSAYKISYR